jgi:hypothetical protein
MSAALMILGVSYKFQQERNIMYETKLKQIMRNQLAKENYLGKIFLA